MQWAPRSRPLQPSETLQADVTVNAPAARQTPHRIRLSGIDAPEKAQPYYGLQSMQSLSDLVVDRMVTVQTGKTDC